MLSKRKNYMAFDYRENSKKDGICGSIFIENISNKSKEYLISSIFYNVKSSVKNHIYKLLNTEEAGTVTGIILGDTSRIEKETLESFRKAGLAHILAVSGTHISYIILGLSFGFKYIKIGKIKIKIILIIILVFFAFIVGGTPSVIRAVIMSCLGIIASILHRKADAINCMNISMIIELIFNPYFLIESGFLLSYGGVLGILILYRPFRNLLSNRFENFKIEKYLKEVILICISVQIIILPVSIYYFNSIVTLFIISNILVVPVARNNNYCCHFSNFNFLFFY